MVMADAARRHRAKPNLGREPINSDFDPTLSMPMTYAPAAIDTITRAPIGTT